MNASLFFFSVFLQVTLGVHLTAPFKTHMASYSIWNIFRGVQGVLTCKPSDPHTSSCKGTHTHTVISEQCGLPFPRFITLSYIRSPCLPTQCGMVTALWLRDGDTEWENRRGRWMRRWQGAAEGWAMKEEPRRSPWVMYSTYGCRFVQAAVYSTRFHFGRHITWATILTNYISVSPAFIWRQNRGLSWFGLDY